MRRFFHIAMLYLSGRNKIKINEITGKSPAVLGSECAKVPAQPESKSRTTGDEAVLRVWMLERQSGGRTVGAET